MVLCWLDSHAEVVAEVVASNFSLHRYCIPLNDNRPVTKAEDMFFSECGTGHVPVIVLFTKLDALDDKGFQLLQKENPDISHEDAADQAPIRAQQIFDEMLP
ncbi:hypothetical protein C0991_003285, partial [Blastosporella zonata]